MSTINLIIRIIRDAKLRAQCKMLAAGTHHGLKRNRPTVERAEDQEGA